ncbi:polysaccharide deacetylase family protein [Selenomonadales bacterium OttesenSCG-928-I06]|nr:polysaccharide deacetylase family protein [Selenomonadales bacterium OttesenSCG-928-I06]
MRWKVIVLPNLRRFRSKFFLSLGIIVAVMALGIFQQDFLISEVTKDDKVLKAIDKGNADIPKIAFACNVFWGEDILPEMLDILDKTNTKITFFIGGSWAAKNPAIVKMIKDRGHELGNHTYSHPHPNNISKEKNKEQIIKTEKLITDITGVKTMLYAPPYGEYNKTVLEAADEIGYKTIMWSIDTIDWQKPPVEVVKKRVLTKIHNGAIVLMHPTDPTLKALPDLIKEIQNKGYIITTVTDVLE